jgi:two-component system, sensor histidine kinase ChiS
MLEGAAGKMNAIQQENVEVVISVARRMSNLINDILDFARLRYSDIPLDLRSVDIRAIVSANLEVFRHYIGTKPVSLELHLSDEIPSVYADENRLLQILYNLIGNAIKFTQQGEIIVSARQEGDKVCISVSDTGIGIPLDKQEAIFKSFEQVGTSVAREYGGTGLGLSIAKQLVKLHGGQLVVASVEGKGSTFSFTIPVSTEQLQSEEVHRSRRTISEELRLPNDLFAAAVESEHSEGDKYTILAVDDDPVNLRVLINAFTDEPYHVRVAKNGEEALNMLEQGKPVDLVILDVMMPGLSGYETCRRIREKHPISDLPVLLVTAKSEPEAMLNGFAVGANDFLAKPFYTYELRARVKTLLDMKRSAEEATLSELAFLQAQIKPHFLYNALNTIVSLSLDDPQTTHDLLLRLSHYLRSSFDFRSKEKRVPLRKELELTESYLFIEKARFADRLRVVYDIESEVDCVLPPLTIQPLVENAVRHGVTKRKEGGKITIAVQSREHFVVITIQDDGIGIPEQKLGTLFAETEGSSGVGLKNIQQRMLRMYGYGLEIESDVGKGTKVTIRIPNA